jgi:PTH1 family peptidyl-tRNA hydrolase
MKYVIIGLGNPGRKYERTRHNAGFMAVEELAGRSGIDITREKHQSLVGRGRIEGQDVILARPQTYMNESGRAVSALLRDEYLSPDTLIVVHDELDLSLGTVRVKQDGGHGGHNGIRSLIEHLGTAEFMRVRIGIGRPAPGQDAAEYVLAPFFADERASADDAVRKAADAVLVILGQDMARAMNQFNQK